MGAQHTPIDWTEVEIEATAVMVAAAEPVVRKVTEDLYEAVLDSVHDYLAENLRFNLASELKVAKADAHDTRMRNLALAKENALLRANLRRLRSHAVTLLQNSEGCVANHHGEDFQVHGMPGFLADARAAVDSADAVLKALGQDAEGVLIGEKE